MTLFFLIVSIIFNIWLVICLIKAFRLIDQLDTWCIMFKTQMKHVYSTLKGLDDRNMFEKDDDVGILFRQIANVIENAKKMIVDDDDIE